MKTHSAYLATTLIGLCVCSGCSPVRSRIDLTTFDDAGKSQHHYANFSRASYRRSPGGLLEVVMRAERASTKDPTQIITQVLYLKTFWNPQPGRTYVEATQINGRAEYAMLTPPTGVRYDGSAFLTGKIDQVTGDLIGHIESGTLEPRYRMGDAAEPFGPARFSGTLRAAERPGEVVNTLQMLDTKFKQ